ncbi:SusC/RagA family TonB-linked outer membrane protein [Chitinophaga sp. Cy-1792]|uniref:SusC/RagA family TonB-linked outer membrane protein n=1 Tax=Chitinophaga sp. Cy-1792 TaxID=2608339 RepID=UPI00141E358B|nr:SusC/RagA family TonB-linked outer membrane protein [Chitinophaga sp. Cy-1792]NIG56483.1 SusC/RagA family TonB-linked outer membrane protein [Chitinophaga sp. Cy-1792]
MKKTVSGLTFLLLFNAAVAQNNSRVISFQKKNITVKEMITVLQQQEKLSVMYDDNALQTSKTLQLPSEKMPLDKLLTLVAASTGMELKQVNNNIYIKSATAQQTTQQQAEMVRLKGTVSGSNNEGSLPGVSISVNGKTVAVTQETGSFDVKAPVGSTITFKAIGLDPYNYPVTADAANLKIIMKQNVTQLDGVIVTALGIRRDEKALGYAATKVTNEQLTDAISNNWTNALTGKVAGLNMLKANGGPAGSTKIILRGENSLTGSSEALIVVDGVIINGSSGRRTGTGSGAYLSDDSPTDYGTSLNDINPDDIENVTVLKGPGAAALYGARGSNGAIIITTKAGRPMVKGLGVTVNSNSTFETINHWPDYQYEYGQGAEGQDTWYSYGATEDGASTRSTSSAWGPKFDGQSYFQYDPNTRTGGTVRTPWVPYKNNRKDFFQTAKTFTNSVSLEGGNSNTNVRLAYTNLNNNWIIPNTGYNRNTVALSLNHKVSDKLQISTKVNYTNKKSDNLPSTGYNNQTIMYFIRGMVPNANINWFKDYWVPGQEQIAQTRPFSSLLDNPYLQAYEMLNKMNRNGIIGNVSATYNFTKDFSLQVRTALDYSTEGRSQQRPKNTQKYVDGMYRTQNIYSREVNSDFLLRYNRTINKFNSSISFGGSRMLNYYNKDEVRADKLKFPGKYNFGNAKNALTTYPYQSTYAVNSLYGLLTFSYNSYLFLDFTGRNDWSSTLANPAGGGNVSFFYPSVNASAILSDIFKMPKEISLLKVRASLAGVGSGGTNPYLTSFGYLTTQFQGGLTNPGSVTNLNLQPMFTQSLEGGIDANFFHNRLGLGLTVYKNSTSKQIVKAPVDKASGFYSAIVNTGTISNEGIEIEANGTPIKQKNGLIWNITGTFSSNKSSIASMPDGIETYVLSTGPANRGSIEARPGGRMGDLYGLGYLRSPDGQIVYNEQGYPIMDQTTKYLGNTMPRWKASMGHSFSYKQFRFSFLVDGQTGGVAYSLTHAVLAEEGKLKKTLPGRYNGIIGDGVIQNPDGTYRKNDVIATNISAYYNAHYTRDNVESNTFRTDFIKVREARFDYTFTPRVLRKMGFNKGTVGIYGRDLFMITNWPLFDPEFGTLGDGDINQGFEIGQFPSTRSFGINITASF